MQHPVQSPIINQYCECSFYLLFSRPYMPIITHGTVQLFLLCHKFQTFKLLCFVLEIMICSQYVYWCCASFNTQKITFIIHTMS